MKLLAFLMQTGGHIAGWRHPQAAENALCDLDYFVSAAQTAERGLFDAVFFADSVGYPGSRSADAFAGQEAPKLDPLMLLSALSVATRNVGLIGTASTTFNEPYPTARRYATLDHLSGGRAGWNIVTSTMPNEAHNHSLAQLPAHADRYRRAAEFVDVSRNLWDSWSDGAVLSDKTSGKYVDPAGISAIDHAGEFFSVAGPLNVPRSPQGHPVLVQAGASPDGKAFAARYADVIFTSHPTIETALAFRQEMHDLLAAQGRAKDALKVLPAITPVIADTREEAQALKAELDALIPLPIAVNKLEQLLGGFDLSSADLDRPLPALPQAYLEGQNSTRDRVLEVAEKQRPSVRDLAMQMAAGRTSQSLVGTPQDIADSLAHWYESGAADGFVIAAPVLPVGLERFVDGVVPLLQQRGLFRRSYEGKTLRDNLGLPRPERIFDMLPDLYRKPEFW
ncbi:LLM class flavin-dependent oxidoreductase [Novosphingobium sp. 9]|uniref:LLM class flavin-dependent oxidoreductase n=1 Tax=Novosphingobium sp. 9 TaxID=2025349 RepID=UPI0021B67922|nr:LLM class flavin-dependent oxidoreductase [Novosphingobium sp. 9]